MATVVGSSSLQNVHVAGLVNVNQRLFNQAGGDWRFSLDPATGTPIQFSHEGNYITPTATQQNIAGFKNYGVFVASPIVVPVGGEETTVNNQLTDPTTTHGPLVPLEACTACYSFEDLNPDMALQPGIWNSVTVPYANFRLYQQNAAQPIVDNIASTYASPPMLYLPEQQPVGQDGDPSGAQPGIIQFSLDPQTQSIGVWSKGIRASNAYFINNTRRILQLFAPGPSDTPQLPPNFTRGSTLVIPPGQARMITFLPPSNIIEDRSDIPDGRIPSGGTVLTGAMGQAPAEVDVELIITDAGGGYTVADVGRVVSQGLGDTGVPPGLWSNFPLAAATSINWEPPIAVLITQVDPNLGTVTGAEIISYSMSYPRVPDPGIGPTISVPKAVDGGTAVVGGAATPFSVALRFNDKAPTIANEPKSETNAYTQFAFLVPSQLPWVN